MPKTGNVLPGIDVQAGTADGGWAFVFLAPTVRLSLDYLVGGLAARMQRMNVTAVLDAGRRGQLYSAVMTDCNRAPGGLR